MSAHDAYLISWMIVNRLHGKMWIFHADQNHGRYDSDKGQIHSKI